MTDQLRTLAEASAYGVEANDREGDAHVRGFIAGRTSVTRDDLFEVIHDAIPNLGTPLASMDGVYGEIAVEVSSAVITYLRGEIDV